MKFDYSKLRGRIREVCKTEGDFALELNLSHQQLSAMLNNKRFFSSKHISKARAILHIEGMVEEYFFTEEVQSFEQEHT